MNIVQKYLDWLHLRWPAGTVERLPQCDEHGRTNVAGAFIVGDLTGVPLLKFALDTGAAAARRCEAELGSKRSTAEDGSVDVVVIGAGVAGMAAAVECERLGLRTLVVETAQPFNTVANFPARKPIFTYPTQMQPRGQLHVTATTKEELLAELRAQVQGSEILILTATAERIARHGAQLSVILKGRLPIVAQRVIVAIGRSGNFRRLGVAGEELPHVSNRLIDPSHHTLQQVVVVGGGDSAVEAALALADAGAKVTLVHRGAELARPKPESIQRARELTTAGRLTVRLDTSISSIRSGVVDLARRAAPREQIAADQVFVLVGREPPLEFFRRSGVRVRGEASMQRQLSAIAFAGLAALLYSMKAFGLFGHSLWNPAEIARQHRAALLAAAAPHDL